MAFLPGKFQNLRYSLLSTLYHGSEGASMGGRCCRSSVPVLSMSVHPRTGQSQMWGGDICGWSCCCLVLSPLAQGGSVACPGLVASFYSSDQLVPRPQLDPTMTGLTDSGCRKQELRRACDSHLHFISGTRGPRTLQGDPSGPPCLSVEQR